tara:strand:- start:2029 stop:2169 length:141 start_codon:yes stop_codon:yes gene_type:complete
MISIITFTIGVVSGIYLSSQLERSINNNIRRNKMNDNINKLDKNND